MGPLLSFGDVNYLAVLAATAAYFVLGGLWYSTPLFAKPWLADTGISFEEAKRTHRAPHYLGAAVLAFLAVLALALVLRTDAGPGVGTLVGLAVGLGLAGAPLVSTGLFNNNPPRLVAVQAGYHVVALTLAGLILGSWQ